MNSRTTDWTRIALVIALAIFSSGCTLPQQTASAALPSPPTGLQGQTSGPTGLFTGDRSPAPRNDDDPVLSGELNHDGGTSLTDFVPPQALVEETRLATLQRDAAYGRYRRAEDAQPYGFVKEGWEDDPNPEFRQAWDEWVRWEQDVDAARSEYDDANDRVRDLAGALGVAP